MTAAGLGRVLQGWLFLIGFGLGFAVAAPVVAQSGPRSAAIPTANHAAPDLAAPDLAAADLARYAQWSLTLQQVAVILGQTVQAASGVIVTDRVWFGRRTGREAVAIKADTLLATAVERQAAFHSALAAISLPDVADRRLAGVAAAGADRLVALAQAVDKTVAIARFGHAAAHAGNAAEFDLAAADMAFRFLVVLDAETAVARATAVSARRGSPARHQSDAIIAGNEALIDLYRMLIAGTGAVDPLATRRPVDPAGAVARMEDEINKGRRSLRHYIMRIATMPADNALKPVLTEAFDLVRQALDIETEMVRLLTALTVEPDSVAALATTLSNAEPALNRLIRQRAALQARRFALFSPDVITSPAPPWQRPDAVIPSQEPRP